MNITIRIIFIILLTCIIRFNYAQSNFSFIDSCYFYSKSILRIDTLDIFSFNKSDTNKIVDIDSITIDVLFDNTKYLNGLDCSMWQNNISWHKIDSIYSFVFIKATQSLRTDVNFNSNWNNCNLIKGAYHFFNPNINGIEQAKHFLSVVKLEKGNLPPVIDVEYYHSYWRHCNRYTAAKNLQLMLEYIEKTTGTKHIIYTNCSFWNKYLAKYVAFNTSYYYLWVANYFKESPCIPIGWTTWTFWQYTHKGRVNEHYTYWDLNYYNGTDLSEILVK